MRVQKLFVLFIALILISCERDDICAETTTTTPRLIIEFYDVLEPEELKSAVRLTAYGEGLITDDDGNIIEPIEESDETLIYNENSSALELPLFVSAEGDLRTVRFILESDTNLRIDDLITTNSNSDTIEISYIPEFVYVSRACGYKSVFSILDIDVEDDDNNWISNIEIIETTIENENTVHLHIFH